MKILNISLATLFFSSPLWGSDQSSSSSKTLGFCTSSMACFEYLGKEGEEAAKKTWCESNAPWWTWEKACDSQKFPTACVTNSLEDQSILWVDGDCVSHLTQVASHEEAIAHYKRLQDEADAKLAKAVAENTRQMETIPERLSGYCKATVRDDFFIPDNMTTSTAKNIGLKKGSEHLISSADVSYHDKVIRIVVTRKDSLLEELQFPPTYFDLSCPFDVMEDAWGSQKDQVVLRPVKIYSDATYTQEICEIQPGIDVNISGTGSGIEWHIESIRGQCEGITDGFTKEGIRYYLYPTSLVKP
ncbi:MAG: hypothetical protein EOP10_17135 [Proteobacteria bacterium]|nr:MAG: hypothetical protein EOP10_17135 [Pseudomonadota bacterium]